MIKTISAALNRVFCEANMLIVRRPAVQTVGPSATMDLYWNHHGTFFQFMIPSSAKFLFSLLFKTNICEQSFFNEARLHIYPNCHLNAAKQAILGHLLLKPVQEPHNVSKH